MIIRVTFVLRIFNLNRLNQCVILLVGVIKRIQIELLNETGIIVIKCLSAWVPSLLLQSKAIQPDQTTYLLSAHPWPTMHFAASRHLVYHPNPFVEGKKKLNREPQETKLSRQQNSQFLTVGMEPKFVWALVKLFSLRKASRRLARKTSMPRAWKPWTTESRFERIGNCFYLSTNMYWRTFTA